jgi:hypothetical protein
MERCWGGELWKRIRQGSYQERGATLQQGLLTL